MTSFAAPWQGRHRFHKMGRHGRHGRPHGPGFDPRMFWREMGFGPGGRRSRARRGDVRAATLLLLEEEPRNGYQLMEEIERRSDGAWRPSPGSIYPALSQLEDEGLIRAEESAGRRSFGLTDDGRAYVDEHREELGSPWEEAGRDVPGELGDLRSSMAQIGIAAFQVMQSGDPEQVAEAKRILADTRKALYQILADAE
jgi:DNA-binding PadR family transcriptional regulator